MCYSADRHRVSHIFHRKEKVLTTNPSSRLWVSLVQSHQVYLFNQRLTCDGKVFTKEENGKLIATKRGNLLLNQEESVSKQLLIDFKFDTFTVILN